MYIPKTFPKPEPTWLRVVEEPEVRWSPFDIQVLLHHYATVSAFERRDAPAYRDTMKRLTDFGLLSWDNMNDLPVITELGSALVKMWCETPIPVVRYIDPRLAQ